MSNEQQPIEGPDSGRGFSFRDANMIQADLIKRSGTDPLKWVDSNAANFREIIESKPDLAELYHQDPKAAEELIEQQLEKKTFH